MEMLPEEMLINILSRLPAKSIGRSRCVSKPWKSLLLQPHFIKTHLNRTKHLPKQEETLILFTCYSYYLYSTQLRIAHQLFDEMSTFATNLSLDDQCLLAVKIKKVACCDGLILVWDDANKLVLFNPTTKESHELITPSYAVDCHANYFTNGLGYDSFSDDYKVVTISYCNVVFDEEQLKANEVDYAEMFVDVYSVKNGTWKRVENTPYYLALNSFDSGVFVDGYIHWRATRILDNLSVIVAFDLKEEKFREIVFPSWIRSVTYEGSHIVALGGCLGMYPDTVAILSYGVDPMEIWIMKEYGVTESWTKYMVCSSGMSIFRPQCLLGKQQVVMEKHDGLGQWGVHKLVVYDWNENACKDIVVHGVTNEFFVGGTSMESLVSPHPHCSTGTVRKKLHLASQRNLVPKEPSRRALSRFIGVINLDSFVVYVLILILGFLVAAIVKWRPDVV